MSQTPSRRRGFRILFWVAVLVAVALVPILFSFTTKAHKDEVAFRDQLRMARQEGVPTTAAEYTARIRPADPSQNAAPLYRLIRGRMSVTVSNSERAVMFQPSPLVISAAERFIAANAKDYALIDQATALPRCWLDRDWSPGPAVVFREYAPMKNAAHMVLFRGSVEASMNQPQLAVADAERALTIARHVREEPQQIAYLVSDAIFNVAVARLAEWSFVHRDQSRYLEEFKIALSKLPRPDERAEHLSDLYSVLVLVDGADDPKWRRDLGFREDPAPAAAARVMGMAMDKGEAKVAIVKAERDYWAALSSNSEDRHNVLADAKLHLYEALLAFPYAATIYEAFDAEGDGVTDRAERAEGWLEVFTAVGRALSQEPIPSKIKTDDLLSPYDHKPLTYSFDGKQMVVRVDAQDRPVQIRIPPDPR